MSQISQIAKPLQPGGSMPLTRKRESLFQDGLRRLVKNRAAVVGFTIIVILILMAIFAPLIAVKRFDTQVLVDQNKAPAWVVKLFPTMKPYVKISTVYPLGADYV